MAIILDGTAGITTPGVTDTGNLSVTGSTTLTGGISGTGVNLATNVTGVLPVANGGTNSTATPTAGGVGYGTGTAHAYTAAGTTGQVLVSGGSGTPTWANSAGNISSDFTISNYSKITLPTNYGSAGNAADWMTVKLSNTSEMLIISGNNAVVAGVWDDTAKLWGSWVTVRTGGVLYNIAANAISSTSVLVCTLQNNTTALQTVVLSVSGTTITVNTPVNTTLPTTLYLPYGSNSGNSTYGGLVTVGTSYVLALSLAGSTGQPYACAITVSGTTPTIGTAVAGNGSYTNCGQYWLQYATSSSVSTFFGVDQTNSAIYVVPFSISGTTVTAATRGGASVSYSGTPVGVYAAPLSSGRYIALSTSASGTSITLWTISGNTVTQSGSTVNDTSVISTTSAMVFGSQVIYSSVGTVNVVTDSAGTLVTGTVIAHSTNGNAFPVGTTATQMIYGSNSAGSRVEVISISGNNPIASNVFGITGAFTSSGISMGLQNLSTKNQYFMDVSSLGVIQTASYKNMANRFSGGYMFAPAVSSTNSSLEVLPAKLPAGSAIRSTLNLAYQWMVECPNTTDYTQMNIALGVLS